MTDASAEPAAERPARIEPLTREEYLRLRRDLGSAPVSEMDAGLHISRTWARNPALMMAQTPLQSYFMTKAALPARLREIAILRIGWCCRSDYEFGQHKVLGRQAGLGDDEITRLAMAGVGTGWSPLERAVIDCADELHASHDISDSTWAALAGHLGPAEIIELLALIGRYWTVSVVTNALRIQLEPGATGIPSAPSPGTAP
ncbi:MAG TPA: carboxymuconolactone decarboxylase family protein [Streptosporangiaceae bacterium]|nr:carboxymuconolactone decarboxylase family protein [Streptosporangiaceae bacterium]